MFFLTKPARPGLTHVLKYFILIFRLLDGKESVFFSIPVVNCFDFQRLLDFYFDIRNLIL